MASFTDIENDPQLVQAIRSTGFPQYGTRQGPAPSTYEWLNQIAHMISGGAVAGGPGRLIGPKATRFAGQTGKLGKSLDKRPDLIHVSDVDVLPYGYTEPTTHGLTVSPGVQAGGKFGSSDIMFPAGRPPSVQSRKALFHEGLHASYNAKGLRGFPPRDYWPQLIDKIKRDYPQHAARVDRIISAGDESTPGEIIIDWLTRNTMGMNRGFRRITP